MNDSIEVELTEGAVKNGYISVASRHPLFPEQYWAEDERDSSAQTFTLTAEDGKTFKTYLLLNRNRFKQRFGAYFKERQIQPGTRVQISKVAEGQYSMGFQMSVKTLNDYYEEYKKNPRTDWIVKYKERCEQFKAMRALDEGDIEEEALRDLWVLKSNGVSGVGPGVMYSQEFEALKESLPKITLKILADPSPEVLDEVIEWAQQEKAKGHTKRILRAVINRVFAAAAPDHYSSVVDEKALSTLISALNDRFALDITKQGNWATRNAAMMAALRAQGLEGEDDYLLNTFAWELVEMLSDTTQAGIDNAEEADVTVEAPLLDEASGPRNLIYYGPPGTGKTYQLQRLLRNNYTDIEAKQSEELFLNEHLGPLKWYEVIALVLLDLGREASVAEIIAHRYYEAKATVNNRTGNLRATAWSYLQTYSVAESTTVNCTRRAEPALFDKLEDSTWYIVDSRRELLADLEELHAYLRKGPQQRRELERFSFVTFHQSYGYEEFVEGLRPLLADDGEMGDIQYEIRPGVFRELCTKARSAPTQRFAMVIDEINRGNISKIFGELITLIEADKRDGEENAVTVSLPYSGESFSVPSNVDIIGTMNTADRSLALLDTALRRRFDFIPLMPDTRDMAGAPLHALRVSIGSQVIDIPRMLSAINQRIEALYDRDHCIGHAYFTGLAKVQDGEARLEALEQLFSNRIVPLLEEYFFEDWEKIRLVLADNQKDEAARFIIESQEHEEDLARLFGNEHGLDSYNTKRHFQIQEPAFTNPDAYLGIYETLQS